MRDLKIVFVEPKGGYEEKRLSMALSLLISEKDFIEYFCQQALDRNNLQQRDPQTNPSRYTWKTVN